MTEAQAAEAIRLLMAIFWLLFGIWGVLMGSAIANVLRNWQR